MIDKNYSQLILRGIEEGDQIGGPYELAKILLRSLELNNGAIIRSKFSILKFIINISDYAWRKS